MSIRTDLAKEAFEHDQPNMEGIEQKQFQPEQEISVEVIDITSDTASQRLHKPKGRYITVTAEYHRKRDVEFHEQVSKVLADQIKILIGEHQREEPILVVGLGNRAMTPDALGPRTVSKLMITRHLLEYIPKQVDERVNSVCAVTPGVLGVTGIESSDIVVSICQKIKPKLVIAIDSLAAYSADRISDTVQLSNTGISPGAGIGNMRQGINQETVGAPVIAIGIPMVVHASSIIDEATKNLTNKDLVSSEINEEIKELIVTPKEIDVIMDDCAKILADGLNLALHNNITLDQVKDFMY